MVIKRLWWLLLMAALGLGGRALAGTACEAYRPDVTAYLGATQLALRSLAVLEDSGADLALVGRVGADLSRHGLKYSHMGIVFRRHPKGRWLFVHLLNQCGGDRSGLYDEGLLNFFMDDPHRLEAVIMIPSPSLQRKLARTLAKGAGHALHQPRYSMLAYPFSTTYQNSNQWVLELIAAAQSGGADRGLIQAHLRATGYQPDRVRLSALERLGAALTRANISFTDHPLSERLNGEYSVVTVSSVLRYLDKIDAPTARHELHASAGME